MTNDNDTNSNDESFSLSKTFGSWGAKADKWLGEAKTKAEEVKTDLGKQAESIGSDLSARTAGIKEGLKEVSSLTGDYIKAVKNVSMSAPKSDAPEAAEGKNDGPKLKP